VKIREIRGVFSFCFSPVTLTSVCTHSQDITFCFTYVYTTSEYLKEK